jgi:hypothetical protein
MAVAAPSVAAPAPRFDHLRSIIEQSQLRAMPWPPFMLLLRANECTMLADHLIEKTADIEKFQIGLDP